MLLATALAAGLPTAVAAAEPGSPEGLRTLGLEEALSLARRNAPAAVQAAGAVRTGRAQVRSAAAAFLPNLTLSAGTSRRYSAEEGGDRIEDGAVVRLPSTPWSYGASFSSSLELFGGGRRLFELRQARAGLTSAEADAVLRRYALDLAVKQQYFDVLAARESERAATAQVEQAEQQLRAARLRVRAAQATKSDSLRSAITLSNAQLALEQARTDLATANAALGRLVGLAEPVTASESEGATPAGIPLDEESLAPLAADGPAVRVAEAERDAARAARAAVWSDYLPALSASYSRGGSGSGTDAFFDGDDLGYAGSLRLSLSLAVFDRFSREGQAVQREVALENAEATLRDTRLAAREDLTRFLGAHHIAERTVETQVATVASAEEDLRVQQQRYALGESTLLDVLTSQTQLNDARATLIRARYDLRVARARLEALVGRDL
jgi:outer membrane protein